MSRRPGVDPFQRAAQIGLLIAGSSWLLAGAVVAVTAARYAPLPGWLAAVAGAVTGVVAAWLLTVHPDVCRWANRCRRQGRWAPPPASMEVFQLVFGAVTVCLATAVTALGLELS